MVNQWKEEPLNLFLLPDAKGQIYLGLSRDLWWGHTTQQVTAHRPRPWLLHCTKDVADGLVKEGQL